MIRCQLCRRRRGYEVVLGRDDDVDRVGALCATCQGRIAEVVRSTVAAARLFHQLDHALLRRLLKALVLAGAG